MVPISLPPLRDRREDIPLLIQHFLQLFSRPGQRQSIPDNIIRALQAYHWPGNVRELQNAVQQYLALQDVDVIGKLPAQVEAVLPDESPAEDITAARPMLSTAVKRFEKRYIESLLHDHQWHRTKVASILGIDRRTLFRKIKSLDIK